ncbi:hypothetical protein [Nocardia cyriacigeorgica]|uniref:hypothetical protein n=1 Tax=Nocardia cyriacigeorgica TaxID=135487 RepID=UPI0013D8A88E|nr:hypothetical protein [Nocardia cyriacigeorgica]NEW27230.1 hypothetical protein [Nocardia cyriacigeorgica]
MTEPEDAPESWVQWDDGSWSPVYADGWTGDRVSLADVLEAAAGPAGIDRPIIDVAPISVRDREGVNMLEPGPDGSASDEPQTQRDQP